MAVAAEGDALDSEEDPLAQVEREIQNRAPEEQPGAAEPDPSLLTPQGARRSGVTESEGRRYRLPDPKLLRKSGKGQGPDTANQDQIAKSLVESLGHFGIEAKIVGRVTGPRVTRHELRLAPGTKVSKVTQLKDDIAYALASTDIRILAPIPGKQAVGVEVPNKLHRMVYLGDIFRRDLGEGGGANGSSGSPLSVWLGKDIAGNSVWTDLSKMPHLLVAGTTGSGKSGCVNTMLSSILLRSSPNEVRMVLVDPKRVELNYYDDIPHLLTPVVTAPRMAANVLANLIREMESRYEVMQKVRSRNIVELNRARSAAGERPLPYILCVIDELADLMMVAPAEVEDSIIRLAQKSRAVGIHLVLATQRPSVDIITGTIKVNVPARIAFRGLLAGGLARDPRPGRGGGPAGPGRHAVAPGRLVQASADPGRLHHRGRGRPPHGCLARAGRAGLRGGADGGPRGDRGGRRRRVLSRPGRPAGGGDPARGADADRLGVDGPAPFAGGIHARRPADRHARAAGRDLRLRGLEAASGADHGSRRVTCARRPAARAGTGRFVAGAGRPAGEP